MLTPSAPVAEGHTREPPKTPDASADTVIEQQSGCSWMPRKALERARTMHCNRLSQTGSMIPCQQTLRLLHCHLRFTKKSESWPKFGNSNPAGALSLPASQYLAVSLRLSLAI